MNLNDLQSKLMASARQAPADDRVPYAFEKRIMARLTGTTPFLDTWAAWGRALWKAAAPCVAAALLCGGWIWWDESQSAPDDFSSDFTMAVLDSTAPDEAW